MARKLSPVTQSSRALVAIAALTLITARATAERPNQQPRQSNAAGSSILVRTATATAKTTSKGPHSQRPAATTYRNPFSADAQAPPNDWSLLPGPLSRWRTSGPRLNDLSAPLSQPLTVQPASPLDESMPVGPTAPLSSTLSIKEAILSVDAPVPADSAWIAPTASDNSPKRNVVSDLSEPRNAAPSALEPPDPTQFTSEPLKELVWLQTDASRKRRPSPIDRAAFESPLNDSALRVPTGVAQPTAESTADMEPIIVSDSADSLADWLAQAQELAAAAKEPGQLLTVVELCQRVLNSNPPDETATSARRLAAWAHNRHGEQFIEAGQPELAFSEFQAAASLDPTNAVAIHNRAVTLAQQNDFHAALLDFNRVLELNPGLAIAYRNRAELLAAQGKKTEAVADYGRAIERMPDDAELYRARAHALQQLGEIERAVTDLDRAIRLAPGDAQGVTQRGNLLAERGEYARALDDFKQSIAINPDLAETRRSLAWLKATCPDDRCRDADEALSEAQTAVKLSPPGDFLALDVIAAAHANAGDFDSAVQAEQQAIQSAPPAAAEPLQARLRLYQQRQPYRTGL
ncbi:MAG: tetratricopeptide repeat protein [Planctomycetes bacterium]|nr:tetratricopeptide repeat protein [Planctomycetota bacterium]